MHKTDVLLVIPPPYLTEMPPLGAAYLSQYLNNKGFKACVMDANILIYRKMRRRDLWIYSRLLWWRDNSAQVMPLFFKLLREKIVACRPRILAFSLTRHNADLALKTASAIKKLYPRIYIVLGGLFINVQPRRSLQEVLKKYPYIDLLVKGEGEKALAAAVARVREGRPPSQGGIIEVNKRNYLPPQRIPVLKMEELGIEYRYGYKKYTGRVFPIMSSRGCAWRCAYCNEYNLWQGVFRQRSVESVMEEVEYNVARGRRRFWFAENSMNADMEWLDNFAARLIQKSIKIEWMSSFMVRKELLKREFLKKLRRSGCFAINYSVDSGSDNILKAIRKPYTASLASRVLRKTHKAGIKNFVSFLVGFPGEKEKDFRKTLQFVSRNAKYIDTVPYCSSIYLQPLSDIYINPLRYGIINSHPRLWRDIRGLNYAERVERQRILISYIENYGLYWDRALVF